jgi:tRNA(Ile)-lysidine synthase
MRYRWLLDTAVSQGCTDIVTGHTMNDQAETVLHHLIRGTGWRGLRGIAPVRKLGQGVRILRPLLSCTRQEILDYAQIHELTPRHDASNDDMRFTRNRIRHQVLPKLTESNSEAIPHLAAWADTARAHYGTLKKTAKLLYSDILAHVDSRQLAIHRSGLAAVNDEVLQELLRLVWSRQRWSVDQMNARSWREVIEICRGVRKAVELPSKIMVKSKELVIQFIQQ